MANILYSTLASFPCDLLSLGWILTFIGIIWNTLTSGQKRINGSKYVVKCDWRQQTVKKEDAPNEKYRYKQGDDNYLPGRIYILGCFVALMVMMISTLNQAPEFSTKIKKWTFKYGLVLSGIILMGIIAYWDIKSECRESGVPQSRGVTTWLVSIGGLLIFFAGILSIYSSRVFSSRIGPKITKDTIKEARMKSPKSNSQNSSKKN